MLVSLPAPSALSSAPTKKHNSLHKEFLLLCPVPGSTSRHCPGNNDRASRTKRFPCIAPGVVLTNRWIQHPSGWSARPKAKHPAAGEASGKAPRAEVPLPKALKF